jgi:hypothetical protein
MLCPRCEQGDIAKAKIIKTEKEVFVCKECEATWFSASAIGVSPFLDFGTYMEGIGLSPLWDELSIEEE